MLALGRRLVRGLPHKLLDDFSREAGTGDEEDGHKRRQCPHDDDHCHWGVSLRVTRGYEVHQ